MTKARCEFLIRSAGDRRLEMYEADTYATLQDAEQAVRAALGWSTLAVSEPFAVDDGTAVCLYETEEECERDQEGAHAPRIVKRDVRERQGSVYLSSADLGEATEDDYDAWVKFVCAHIDQAAGFEVLVQARPFGMPDPDSFAGDEETREELRRIVGELWERWCSEGAPGTQPQCACGRATGVACVWHGDASELVTVERMPEHLRASHTAASNRGTWPANGAERLDVSPACARDLLESDPDWTRRV